MTGPRPFPGAGAGAEVFPALEHAALTAELEALRAEVAVLREREANLRDALWAAGWTPPDNFCGACHHAGGEHDLGNWCLKCPRPETKVRTFSGRIEAGWCYFSSMDGPELWASGIERLREAQARSGKRGEPGVLP